MGSKYVENRQVEFAKSYEESGPGTPIFFILSPGVDPLKDVEALGKKLGFTMDNKNFHNVSLGQVSCGCIACVLFCFVCPIHQSGKACLGRTVGEDFTSIVTFALKETYNFFFAFVFVRRL